MTEHAVLTNESLLLNRTKCQHNFFMSLKKQLQHSITILGNLRSNKKEKPSELLCDCNSLNAILVTEDGTIMIAFYKAKQKRKIILFVIYCMNTFQSPDVEDAKEGPEAILYHDSTNGGVDTTDEMLHSYSTASRSGVANLLKRECHRKKSQSCGGRTQEIHLILKKNNLQYNQSM